MAENDSELSRNIIGFVDDSVSEQIIVTTIDKMGLPHSSVFRGGVMDVVDFLKKNKPPKILIIDVSELELPVGEVAKIKEYAAPDVNFIIIGGRNEVGLFRDFMDIGVIDYLVKPLSIDLVQRAIEGVDVARRSITRKSGKLVYFANSVGGAGATTTAVNVGWLLSNRYFKRTVVIDTDFCYGSAHLLMDIRAESSYVKALGSFDKIDDYFVDTFLKRYDQRLFYLDGLLDLNDDDTVNAEAFGTLVSYIKEGFNYVLVDSKRQPCSANEISMNLADIFVLMVEMSVASVQNSVRVLQFLYSRYPTKKIIVVANRIGMSSSGALSKESFEEVIARKIDYVMPHDDRMPLASANIGQPLASINCAMTSSLESIAEDILGKTDYLRIGKNLGKNTSAVLDKIKSIFKKK
ncbi:MAG: hypothetical protein LBB63_03805 [Holosporaceae bacterium]|jgi:pilus assembly protein CpaE|nr:hypothetical protein [Holosporaceae bacterium]